MDLSSENDSLLDYKMTKWMIKNIGLQTIPPTVFYSEDHKPLAEYYVRFCFYKKDELLQEAAEILEKWAAKL